MGVVAVVAVGAVAVFLLLVRLALRTAIDVGVIPGAVAVVITVG